MNKKIIFRVTAAVIAFILIYMVLSVTNSAVGNPISKAFAKEKAKIYISENYEQLNLEIKKVSYNFKDKNYMISVQSKTSIDTHFALYYRNGKINNTSYEMNVLEGQNTYYRIANEYESYITPILETALGKNFKSVNLIPNKDTMFTNLLPLDVAFEKSLITDGWLSINCNYTQTDSKYLANILLTAYTSLAEEGYAFGSFSLTGDDQEIMVQIYGVTVDQITSGNLEQLIEQAKVTGESNGISIFIKGDK